MDPVNLKRDDLERELVRKDKQAVITDCLKIFDFNTIMYHTKLDNEKQILELVQDKKGLEMQIEVLEARSWFYMMLKRLRIK
jgi:hypothetical protein